MASFSEASQWVDVTQYANYDYVVCDITTMNITCATFTPVVGNQIVGQTDGQIGYIFRQNGSAFDVANVTSTVFDAGTDYYVDNGGTTYSATVSSVSVTFGAQNKPLSELVDRTKYNKDQFDAHNGCTSTSGAHPIVQEGGTGFVGAAHLAPFRNRIINARFEVWQRGENGTISTNGAPVFMGDRHYAIKANTASGQFNVARTTLSTNIGTVSAGRLTIDSPISLSAANSYLTTYFYAMEGNHSSDLTGSTISISFDFMSNTTGTFSVALRTNVGADNSYIYDFDYSTVSTVQHISTQVYIPPTVSINAGTTMGLQLLIANDVGTTYQSATIGAWVSGNYQQSDEAINWSQTTNNYIELANIQITKSEYEQPFEWIPYDIDFMRCERYYQPIGTVQVSGYTTDGTTQPNTYRLSPAMRRAPTIVKTLNAASGAKDYNIIAYTAKEITAISESTVVTGGAFAVSWHSVACHAELYSPQV